MTPAASGAANMALDEALMRHAARSSHWTLRIYSWSTATLSFGRNQRALDLYDPARVAAGGVRVLRRPTGGRALLHDAELTYSVTAPVAGAGRLSMAYTRINRLLVHALRAVGVDAQLAGLDRGRSGPPGAAPCFDHPAPGEIIVGGRKLAASAQWRSEGALLQHGSVLLSGDQSAVASLLRVPVPAPPAPATLGELLGGTPSMDALAQALFGAVRALEDPGATRLDIGDEITSDVRRLHARYADPSWTWRR